MSTGSLHEVVNSPGRYDCHLQQSALEMIRGTNAF